MKVQFEDNNLGLKIKIAALWTSFMFLYIYVDYFHLYMTGSISQIMSGKMFVFDITQGALLAGLISVTIPALMIFLTVALPVKINRWSNFIIAVIYVPYTLFNLVGDVWIHMIFGAVIEVALLLAILRYSLNLKNEQGPVLNP